MIEVISGWGRYPRTPSDVQAPRDAAAAAQLVAAPPGLICRGQGRSYGDSSLQERVLLTRQLDHFLAFDGVNGSITCEAGATLGAILDLVLPRGWFLPVTPGTQFVSVGGAIASDVHGKNHHLDGSFSRHVLEMDVLLGDGRVLRVSPDQHADLFHATCGGMGLTGVILRATLRLRSVLSGDIEQTVIRTANLEQTLELFETHGAATYSVAWIDCLARGRALGRSLLLLGEHAAVGASERRPARPMKVPMNGPGWLLNRLTVRAFNAAYYHAATPGRSTVSHVPYFYPLDAIGGWNRLYGGGGFVQYQFVLPKSAGVNPLRQLLERIAASGMGSFLAVLKMLGPANASPLSFPMEGFTLALDFKADQAALALLDRLDPIVASHGGRLYLSKDARMSPATFKAMYPQWHEFEEIRAKYQATGRFWSHQSRRLGLS